MQKLLEDEFKKIPNLVLHQLIEKKLRAAGVNPEPVLVKQIIAHVRGSNSSLFHWDDGKEGNTEITLSISDEDVKEAEGMLLRLMESMPDVIDKTATTIAQSILKTLKQKWPEEYLLQKAEFSTFRQSLENRWGEPLGMLRMLLTMSREFGSEIEKIRPTKKSHLNNALLRLHVRACQVVAEIITLLENGYADGAMARWRTLYEINIVMTLISEYGEQLAERYIAHRVVEDKSGKDQYELCHKQLGYQPLTKKESNDIEKAFEAAMSKYGKEFSGPYGWAAGYVQKGKRGIGLKEIEMAAQQSAMASYYKLASHNVHAGPHALFFRLGLMGESGLLAGASNAGLTEPGQNAAYTLTSISILLAKDCADLDTITMMKIMIQLRNEIPHAFVLADKKLRKDHLGLRKGTRVRRSAVKA